MASLRVLTIYPPSAPRAAVAQRDASSSESQAGLRRLANGTPVLFFGLLANYKVADLSKNGLNR